MNSGDTMNAAALLNIGIAIFLTAGAGARAATIIEDMPGSPPVLPHESTQRFLGGVRDFGDGLPSRTITHSTGGIAQALNSPAALKGPSITSTGTPPPHRPLGGRRLQGGTVTPQR